MTEMYLTPGWVIVGADQPENHPDRRVVVVASQKLTSAELVKRLPKYEALGQEWVADIQPQPWDMTMVLEELTIVLAPTYAEALQRLFAAWSPDVRQTEHVAIENPRTNGRSELPPPRPLAWWPGAEG